MTDQHHYLIRGGIEGRERLRVLGRVMRRGTLALLERPGSRPGRCPGRRLRRRRRDLRPRRAVGPTGRVVGVDVDPVKIDLARGDAESARSATSTSASATSPPGWARRSTTSSTPRFVLCDLRDPPQEPLRLMVGRPPARRAARRRGHRLRTAPTVTRVTGDWEPLRGDLHRTAVAQLGGDPYFGMRSAAAVARRRPPRHPDRHRASPAALEGEVKVRRAVASAARTSSVVRGTRSPPRTRSTDLIDAGTRSRGPDDVRGRTVPVVQAWGTKPTVG